MDKLGVFGILFVLIIIILMPLFQIWSLNTILDLGIGYGMAEWFAMLGVNSIFASSYYNRN